LSVILGIESTCDETAAAVVVDGRRVLSSVVASQAEVHAKFRGVVPEIASRAHVEAIGPVLREAVATAGVSLADVDAVAVASRPGLIGSLLVGVTAAKTLAWALGKPLVAVDHVQAHLYSVVLDHEQAVSRDDFKTVKNPAKPVLRYAEGPGFPQFDPGLRRTSDAGLARMESPLNGASFPAVGLVCSGGHTALYRLGTWSDAQLIGSTIDDAVGEAYDKVAAILGLGYPGGPILDRLAATGDPAAVNLPRSMLERDSLDFSFSGLKTAVLYHVRGVPSRRDPRPSKPPPTADEVADIAASFQAACVGVLVEKLRRAVERTSARSVIVGGGVSANGGLRAALATFAVPARFPSLRYCTDNAAMIAGLADVHLAAGRVAGLDLDAVTFSEIPRAAG
jgi:N6-L-threonylcarbamoyladenine synthase